MKEDCKMEGVQPIFSARMDERCGISAVQLAVKSNSFVQLHVNNTIQVIPVKNLIKVSESEECFVEGASYSTLRHCAVSSLFKFSSTPVPKYAKNFDTRIVYQHHKDERLVKNDDDLFEALNFAVTENLMDENDGMILNFWCRSINMCPKNISKSPLQIAIKAEMLIKVHVNDNGGMTSIIPVKNLVKYAMSREGNCEMACASRLRRNVLSSFFKRASEKSLRSFGANIVYRSNGEDIPVNTDEDFTRVVETAALEYAPVLHLYCRMIDLSPRKKCINTLGSKNVGRMRFDHIEKRYSRTHQVDLISTEEMQKIQDAASAAADKVVNTMKCWIGKVRHFVEERQEKRCYEDYVKIPDPKKDNDPDPFNWGARFLHLLLLPELEDTALVRQGNDFVVDILKNIASIIEEGSARASDMIEDAIAIHTKGQSTKEECSSCSSDESSISNRTVECSSVDDHVSIGDDNSNSIMQDKEEWKAFFLEPFDEAILIERHDDASSDISSFEDVSEINDDDDSWVIESD